MKNKQKTTLYPLPCTALDEERRVMVDIFIIFFLYQIMIGTPIHQPTLLAKINDNPIISSFSISSFKHSLCLDGLLLTAIATPLPAEERSSRLPSDFAIIYEE